MKESDILLKYLNKRYYIRNNTFIYKPDEVKWGREIVNQLKVVFNYDADFCYNFLKNWAYNSGFPNDEKLWYQSYQTKKLRYGWTPEIAQDIQSCNQIDAESEALILIINGLAEEINSKFISSFLNSEIDRTEIFEAMKCEGYELGPLIYNPTTFSPFKSFLSITYDQMLNERKNNIHWQNWIRSTKRNEKT